MSNLTIHIPATGCLFEVAILGKKGGPNQGNFLTTTNTERHHPFSKYSGMVPSSVTAILMEAQAEFIKNPVPEVEKKGGWYKTFDDETLCVIRVWNLDACDWDYVVAKADRKYDITANTGHGCVPVIMSLCQSRLYKNKVWLGTRFIDTGGGTECQVQFTAVAEITDRMAEFNAAEEISRKSYNRSRPTLP
jgi:hypothetical protein